MFSRSPVQPHLSAKKQQTLRVPPTWSPPGLFPQSTRHTPFASWTRVV
ncbi:hypothetical protein CGRA01v4_05379 [Colletotrichum graminicola]|nr:hypothetical protein CGRA01v4_05379 [Colletotrichum graminicola]